VHAPPLSLRARKGEYKKKRRRKAGTRRKEGRRNCRLCGAAKLSQRVEQEDRDTKFKVEAIRGRNPTNLKKKNYGEKRKIASKG